MALESAGYRSDGTCHGQELIRSCVLPDLRTTAEECFACGEWQSERGLRLTDTGNHRLPARSGEGVGV